MAQHVASAHVDERRGKLAFLAAERLDVRAELGRTVERRRRRVQGVDVRQQDQACGACVVARGVREIRRPLEAENLDGGGQRARDDRLGIARGRDCGERFVQAGKRGDGTPGRKTLAIEFEQPALECRRLASPARTPQGRISSG